MDASLSFTARVLSAINLLGNVILMVPCGILAPRSVVSLQSFRKFMFGVLWFVFLMECLQLFTLRGTFDVDDILLNVIGAAAGFGINRKLVVLK